MKSILFCSALLFSLLSPVYAQFYSVKSAGEHIRRFELFKTRERKNADSLTGAEKAMKEHKAKHHGTEEDRKTTEKTERKVPNPSSREQETLEKLDRRLGMCMPLDELRVSSGWGMRRDPVNRCTAFHDGVDLVCRKAYVYAMLPAVVRKVRRGNKGYGNYVILDHGGLECLYGHLDRIVVREGDEIEAGTIVGVSGNTGKSTGYHLHVRLRREGVSIDPQKFLAVLKAGIEALDKDLSGVIASAATFQGSELTPVRLYEEIRAQRLLFPRIVLAQAMLETGYLSSRVCRECNNLFGLRKRDGAYFCFERWEDSVKAYRDYVQYKYKGGDYFDFLDSIGYAEDRRYTAKVRKIVREERSRKR